VSNDSTSSPIREDPPDQWEELHRRATSIIEHVIAQLPDPLRAEAKRVGYHLARTCPDDDGTLGDYDYETETIRLFLLSLQRFTQEEELDFFSELRKTYLHELGHHLGLDEDGVEGYGL
jgi:hypothetical protein